MRGQLKKVVNFFEENVHPVTWWSTVFSVDRCSQTTRLRLLERSVYNTVAKDARRPADHAVSDNVRYSYVHLHTSHVHALA